MRRAADRTLAPARSFAGISDGVRFAPRESPAHAPCRHVYSHAATHHRTEWLPKFRGERLHRCHLLRSEARTSELQSLMRTSYAVFCLKNTTHRPSPQMPTVLTHRQSTPPNT